MRATFYDDNHNGYTYDTFRKEEYGETFDHGGRVTLLYKPGDNTKIHLYLTGDDFSTGAENLLYTPPDDHTYFYSVNDYYVPSFTTPGFGPRPCRSTISSAATSHSRRIHRTSGRTIGE